MSERELRAVRAKCGVVFQYSALLDSHDMTQAFTLASRLHVLDNGRLVASGPPAELREQAGSLAARFFDASRASPGAMAPESPSRVQR